MTVEELVRKLKEMPQDAVILDNGECHEIFIGLEKTEAEIIPNGYSEYKPVVLIEYYVYGS